MTTRQSYVGKADYANANTPAAKRTRRITPLPDERQNANPPIFSLSLVSEPADPSEVWKPFPGFERRYEVSNMGRVCTWPGELILHPSAHPDGYACLWLRRPRTQKFTAYSLHWAVAMAFLPNPLGLPFVNHKDSNLFNNLLSNLEWAPLPPTSTPLHASTSQTLPSHD